MIDKPLTLLAALLLLAGIPAMAEQGHHDIQIGQSWALATPPAVQVGAGYATITNAGAQPDRLLGADTQVAGKVEIHLMRHENGLMTMRPLSDGVEIPAGGTLELQPGGVHLMFLDLIRPLKPGETFPVTLDFQHSGPVEAEFTVRPAVGHHGDEAQAAHSH